MIYCKSNKFVFIHNPKVAGTAIRKVIGSYHEYSDEFWGIRKLKFFGITQDLAHLRLWELQAEYPEVFEGLQAMNSIVLCRNPVERFISAFFEHYSQFRSIPVAHLSPAFIRALLYWFITRELDMNKVIHNYKYVHFSPQTWYSHIGRQRLVKHIVPLGGDAASMETLFDICGIPPTEVPVANLRSRKIYRELITKNLLEFVHEFYRADYAFMESCPALRNLCRDPPAPQSRPKRTETEIAGAAGISCD